ncbi:MAG TPA: hypothetical protein VGE50_09190 [Gammaproteobacteria bacterium]
MSEVTLSVVGLSPQEGTVVNVAANLLAALDHSVKVLGSGDYSGDIVLLSPASEAGKAALGSLAAGQRAVLFVDSEDQGQGHASLLRPVRVQTLHDLLVELLTRLSTRSVAAPVAATPATTAKPIAASPLPGNLFYLLLDAMLSRSLLRVECCEGSVVLIHGPTRGIYTRVDSITMARVAQSGPELLRVDRLGESEFMQAARGMSLTRLHDVIWLAERHGSRGVLPEGHSTEVPVRLKVWPKFNSRHVRPEYLKLAALLSRQPLTLHALASAGGVALPQVIDFYNAALAFGVVESKASAPVVTPLPSKSPANAGLLSKIARRLALKRD